MRAPADTAAGHPPAADVVDGCRPAMRRWPAANGCDVYVAGAVEPAELAAARWLAERGYFVGRPFPVPTARGPAADQLTSRETELLRALSVGLGNDQIARLLSISRSTVEFHLTRIFKKLDVASRSEAIARVLHNAVPL